MSIGAATHHSWTLGYLRRTVSDASRNIFDKRVLIAEYFGHPATGWTVSHAMMKGVLYVLTKKTDNTFTGIYLGQKWGKPLGYERWCAGRSASKFLILLVYFDLDRVQVREL